MNIIFLGPPGAGKGTVAARIAEKYKIAHISTGDMFREAVKDKSEVGLAVKKYLDSGGLVPDELTINVLQARIRKDDAKNGFILDGFPRTLIQAEALLVSEVKIDKVLYFEVTPKTLIQRLGGRLTCKNCGSIFHEQNVPPKKPGVCDNCGGPLYKRKDQEPEAIKERLKLYDEKTHILVEFYDSKGILQRVNADNTPKKVLLDAEEMLGLEPVTA